MFTSTSGRSSSAATNATRQQLDELDALLQQMLELPVSPDTAHTPGEPTDGGPTLTPAENSSATVTAAPIVHGPEAAAGQGPISLFPYTVTEVVSAPLSMRPSASSPLEAPNLPTRPTEEDAQRNEAQRKLDAAFAAAAAPATPTDPLKAAEVGAEEEEWVPFRSSWQPSPQTWQPLVESWQQGQSLRTNPAGTASPSSAEPGPVALRDKSIPPTLAPGSIPPTQHPGSIPIAQYPVSTPTTQPPGGRDTLVPLPMKPIAPSAAPKPSSSPPRAPHAAPQREEPDRTPVILWPLVLVNGLFDLVLWPSGPLGSALRTRGGRSFLGMVGLGCLAAATAWALLDYLGLDLVARLR